MFTGEYFSNRVSAQTGGGASAKCRQLQTGGGSQKSLKMCKHPLWMAPNCFSLLLIAESHYISYTFSRYGFQIRQNIFLGIPKVIVFRECLKHYITTFFLYFPSFVEFQQILLSGTGMGLLGGAVMRG